ncbi:CRISPR-associated endoribonuclease Cas6 [Alkaliphilus sp. MSJ-5]|uniref:CRISPR-associated endoribonuclease Cas6 n=1 Tax=Alkaliphilus flagellatus TaxID=2841507 RepID=A0ABS6G731_9FIRM|nr:CRISPR-associated endoribonuclease Cas6 [Alkaliphilus flagellatus]MBU5677235.1 CRISPR-associated endoribonuclease Cas6 [Alkaliphilus flagellatus]
MKVYELKLKVFLLKNIDSKNALEKISELIDKSLSKNPELYEFHKKNQFKNYCFNSLYNLEQDGVYKEGSIYSVIIRTTDEKLSQSFKKNLVNEYTQYIKALTFENKIIPKKHIEKIYSITPLVVKTDNGYWRQELSLEAYEQRITANIIKKYNAYFNTKLDENFEIFNMIEFNNRKPIATPYKNVSLLGDKLTFYIADNETAQKLAYFVLGAGVGEMNSRGFGFINYRTI